MAKSIKLGSDTYLDASGVEVNSTSASLRTDLQSWTGSTQGILTGVWANNTTGQITMESATRLILITTAISNTGKNIIIVACSGTGAVSYKVIGDLGGGVTITPDTNKISITNGTGSSMNILVFALVGKVVSIA